MGTLQACLGATKKQLGADKFGDVVKTGSATALAAVTLWNQVPGVAPAAVIRASILALMLSGIAQSGCQTFSRRGTPSTVGRDARGEGTL